MKPSAVGAGIGFQPIGMTALHRLGLLETIENMVLGSMGFGRTRWTAAQS